MRIFLTFFVFFGMGKLFSQDLGTYFPKDSQLLYNSEIKIKWNDFKQASNYQLFIDSSASFSNPDSFTVNATELAFSPDTNYNARYYYYLRTDTNQVAVYSDTLSFYYFNPRNVPGLSLWVSADKGVDSSNSKVQKWEDQSGNQNDLLMSSTAKQPVFYDSSLNGLPSIYFDAIDDGMSSTLSVDSNDYLMCVLYNCHDLGTDIRRTIHGSNNWLLGKYGSNYNIFAGGFTGGMAFSPYQFIVQTGVYESGLMKNYINSDFKGSLNTTVMPGKVGLGSWSGSNRLNGEVSEWLLYKSSISDSIQLLIEKYVMDKYAPPLNLGKDVLTCALPYQLDAYSNSYVEYQWSNTSTDSIITVSTEGFYKLRVKDVFGRYSEDSIYIKLDTMQAKVQFAEDSIHICKGNSIELNAGTERYSYKWNTGDSSSYIIADSTAWYHVEMKNCLAEISTDSVFVQLHFPKFSLGSDSSICFYELLGLKADSSIQGSYLWSTNETADSITVNSSGTYSLQITDMANCSYRDSIFVEVDSTLFTLELGPDTSLCSGNSIAFQSKVPDSAIFLWSNGSRDSSLVVDSSQIYSVSLSFANCSIKDSLFVNIKGLAPEVDFKVDNTCFGDSIVFMDASTSLDASKISEWYWNFGDGDTASKQHPKHVYDSSNSYFVSLNIRTDAGCSASKLDTVTIYPKPLADFSASNACAEAVIAFNNNSSIEQGSIQSYSWDFGTGDTSAVDIENPYYWYDSAANYQVKLIVQSDRNCVDSTTKILEVHPAVQIDFIIDGHCLGDSTKIVNLSTISSGSIVKHEWNFGNGFNSTKENPSTIYLQKGDYVISYRATSDKNCQKNFRDTLSMYSLPDADFILADYCENEQVNVIGNSSLPDDSIISYRYIFASEDTSFLPSPIFGAMPKGSYPLRLLVESSNACRDSIEKVVEVHAKPTASFSILNNHSAVPLDLMVDERSQGASTYYWYFGTGDKSNTRIPIYTYQDTGSFELKLKVENQFGCVDSMMQSLLVMPDYLDAALTNFFVEEKEGLLKVSGSLLNMGSTSIGEVQLVLSSSNGIKLVHNIEETVFSGQKLGFEFQNSLQANESIDYLCLDIVKVNGKEDERSDNNQVCRSTSKEGLSVNLVPNPVSSFLNVHFVLEQRAQLEIILYDYKGRAIRSLFNAIQDEGYQKLTVDMQNYPRGIYFLNFRYKGEMHSVSFIKH